MDYDCGEISRPGNVGLYHRTHETVVLAMVGPRVTSASPGTLTEVASFATRAAETRLAQPPTIAAPAPGPWYAPGRTSDYAPAWGEL